MVGQSSLMGLKLLILRSAKKGLKGHKTSLLEAIRIMLEVGPALQADEEHERTMKMKIYATLRKMGVEVPEASE